MTEDVNTVKESPFACDMTAVGPGERGRRLATTGEFFHAVEAVRELPYGYAFRLLKEADVLVRVAEFISLERLCCPFFRFDLGGEAEGGPLWLSLTGREGAEAFIRAEVGGHLGEAVRPAEWPANQVRRRGGRSA